jgi:hypothetical protein
MTMVPKLRRPMTRASWHRRWVACRAALVLLVGLIVASPLAAQTPGVHYRHHGMTPPGAIGQEQLRRGGPLPGYFQPADIIAPQGALVSLAVNGDFADPLPEATIVGMLIGPVYRLRVANIPLQEGLEVFPTIEIIDRLYPPAGQAWRFPIPIELTVDDLALALAGKFVTRVIYLEEPATALPVATGGAQQWFDAGPGSNPLLEADRLGRPVAILRMGGRIPDQNNGPDEQFLGGCPPVMILQRPKMPLPRVLPKNQPGAIPGNNPAGQALPNAAPAETTEP